jgi:hypothetical protein
MIGEQLVRKGVRNVGTVEAPIYEREFRPVVVGEAVLRMLLQGDEDYSLAKFLPPLTAADVEPRETQLPVTEPAPEAPTPTVMNPEELAAGKRTAARWAELGSAEKTRQEAQRGAEVSARHRLRGQPGSNPAA